MDEEEEFIEDTPEISAPGKESFPAAVSKSGSQPPPPPPPPREEVETMQTLGRGERHMGPPVSGARMQGGCCSVLSRDFTLKTSNT